MNKYSADLKITCHAILHVYITTSRTLIKCFPNFVGLWVMVRPQVYQFFKVEGQAYGRKDPSSFIISDFFSLHT